MSEVALWATLRGLVPRGQYSRIESGDTAPGFPDVHYQLRGGARRAERVSGTLELKDSPHISGIPFRDEDEGIHLSQKIWIRDNIANGGICWIVARSRGLTYWIFGDRADQFNGCRDLGGLSTYIVDLSHMTPMDVRCIDKMLRGSLKP